MSEPSRTPLHDWHVRHGARMVDFAGWEMPIQFAGILEEHAAVRERAGLFDVSHMGEVRLRGVDALPTLQRLTVNDASLIGPGRAQYTAMTTPEGGMIDDLLVYCLGPEEYLLVVNAGTTAKDVAWIREHSEGDVQIEDESTRWAQLAIQGPKAQASLAPLVDVDLDGIAYYRFGGYRDRWSPGNRVAYRIHRRGWFRNLPSARASLGFRRRAARVWAAARCATHRTRSTRHAAARSPACCCTAPT